MGVSTLAGALSTSLDADDYRRSLEFVLKLYYLWGGATGDFRGSGVERDIGKYIHDHMGGKLAEVAVQRILRKYGKEVKIGFERYSSEEEMHQGDIEGVQDPNGTFRAPNLLVQIKETKPGNQWWTIPWSEWMGARQDVYVFVQVDLPLDHLVRHFKPVLSLAEQALTDAIPEESQMYASIVAVYFRSEIEQLGGYVQAGVDYFFDAENLFTPAPRVPSNASVEEENVSTLRFEISSQEFRVEGKAGLYRKQNPKSVTRYLLCHEVVKIDHPVARKYSLNPGAYRIVDRVQSGYREDNFAIHRRNVELREEQWIKMVREL